MEGLPERIVLPDGTEIWARVGRLPELPGDANDEADEETDDDSGPEDGLEDVAIWDTLRRRVRGLDGIVTGVAASVRSATAAVAPDEVSVTFGVEMAVKTGGAFALLADGQVGTNLSITLTWNGSRTGGQDGAGGTPPGGTAPPAAGGQ